MKIVQQAPPSQPADPPQQMPLNLGNLDNFLHLDTPEDALMNDAELAGLEPHLLGQPEEANHLQVGMDRIIEVTLDFLKSAMNRIDLRHLGKSSPKNESSMIVKIPKEWDAFFYSLLPDPSHVSWAKEFVLSNLAGLLSPNGPTSILDIPKEGSNSTNKNCLQLSEWKPMYTEEDALGEYFIFQDEFNDNTPKRPEGSKRARVKECLVDSDVKRSNRFKIRNKSFKQNSYGKTNCIGYSNQPLIISNSVIRNLGRELCQIDPEMLPDDILKKKKDMGAIGASKKGAKTSKNKKNNDMSNTKKNED